jgi:hypothetical protein
MQDLRAGGGGGRDCDDLFLQQFYSNPPFLPYRPSPGELRRVHIDKSVEPLGIQISCLESGGVFVSTVSEHSLASQVGLQVSMDWVMV